MSRELQTFSRKVENGEDDDCSSEDERRRHSDSTHDRQQQQARPVVVKNQNLLEGWCSWCFMYQKHLIVQNNYFRRSVYRCQNCLQRTLPCRGPNYDFIGCSSFARGHTQGDDQRCFLCMGMIEDWNNERNPDLFIQQGWCSWCYQKTIHELQSTGWVGRDMFRCKGCNRATLACTTCDDAFVEGEGVVLEFKQCAKCVGTIKYWEDEIHNKSAADVRAHCSWCFGMTCHKVETSGMFFRTVYRCQECFARTLVCLQCLQGHARGGIEWDDKQCAQCQGFDWTTVKACRDKAFQRVRTFEELDEDLKRQTPERTAAKAEGMLRPFLLLVSMLPSLRNQVAVSLGFPLLIEPAFGDSHREAWLIISKSLKGIQARSNELWETLNPVAMNCNWYDVLYRVCSKLFQESSAPSLLYHESLLRCQDPTDTLLMEMELETLHHIASCQRKHMTMSQEQGADEMFRSEQIQVLVQQMKSDGGLTDRQCKLIVDSIYLALENDGVSADNSVQEAVRMLQREFGTDSPFSAATVRGVQSSVCCKAVLATGALVGASAVIAGPLFAFGMAWLSMEVMLIKFGSSVDVLLPGIVQILLHEMVLTVQGIRISEYLKY